MVALLTPNCRFSIESRAKDQLPIDNPQSPIGIGCYRPGALPAVPAVESAAAFCEALP